ncbi:NlpC/P60 family protein [Dietzia sp. ANT_WB102]|nr:NlpC/P60 family protein [Dietzia sp. ANT_WB102]
MQQVADAIGRADFGSIAQGPAAPGPAAPGPGGGQGGNSGPPSNSARVETVVNRALSQLGVPYAWGGGDAKGPTRGIRDGGVADSHGDYNKIGFDCSGLMIYAFAGIGKALPHYTGYQYTAGPQHPVATRQRGDMLFWPGHVALYLGDGKMVEAPQSGDVVKISSVRMAGIWPMVVRLV